MPSTGSRASPEPGRRLSSDELRFLSDEVGSQLDTILAGMKDGSIDGQSAIAQLQQAGMSARPKADQIRQASISDSAQEDEPEDEDGEAEPEEEGNGEEAGAEAANDDDP